MPENGGGMDTKTILLVVGLLGGTNALQAIGVTMPANQTRAEAETMQSSCIEQLDACITKLMNCAEKRDHDHAYEPDVVANMSYDPQLEESWQMKTE